MRQYVVGDIHGCLAELRFLIEALSLKREDRVVFLGDYVDRGPDSKGVVSYLLGLQARTACEIVCLKGNHEDMLVAYLGLAGNHGDAFLFNGGWPTLASYGISEREAVPNLCRSKIPQEHLDFYTGLKSFYLMDSYLCVHAGINPAKSMNEQQDEEMLWIRHEFISKEHSFPYTVLFGHTPFKSVFFNLPYKIGLDTGLVYGNALSCLETSEKVLFQIKRGTTRVNRIPVSHHWTERRASVSV